MKVYALCFLQMCGILIAQTDTSGTFPSAKSASLPSPRKAAWLSAALPGSGQAYNKAWWKIPVIYAGFGTFGYLYYYNDKQYQFVRKNLLAQVDNDPATINQTGLPAEQLSIYKKQFKNRRDLALAGILAVYFIQIVEAHVDAHLKTFDVSDNLGLYFVPVPIGNRFSLHASLCIKI